MVTPAYIKAHEHSSFHRVEILRSDLCGCFHCLAIFSPRGIEEWTDFRSGIGQTAICPKCDIDSVIGSLSGYPITHGFLDQMRQYWFRPVTTPPPRFSAR